MEERSGDRDKRKKSKNPWVKLARNVRGFVDDVKDFAEDVIDGWEELFAHGNDDKHGDAHRRHQAHHHRNWPQQQMPAHLAWSMPPAMMTDHLAMQGLGGSALYDRQYYSCPPGFAAPATRTSSSPYQQGREVPFQVAAPQAGAIMQSQQWSGSLPPTAGPSPFALGSSPQLLPQAPLRSVGPGTTGGYYGSVPSLEAPALSQPGSMNLGVPQSGGALQSPLGSMGALPPGSMGFLPYPAVSPHGAAWNSAAFVSAF